MSIILFLIVFLVSVFIFRDKLQELDDRYPKFSNGIIITLGVCGIIIAIAIPWLMILYREW